MQGLWLGDWGGLSGGASPGVWALGIWRNWSRGKCPPFCAEGVRPVSDLTAPPRVPHNTRTTVTKPVAPWWKLEFQPDIRSSPPSQSWGSEQREGAPVL